MPLYRPVDMYIKVRDDIIATEGQRLYICICPNPVVHCFMCIDRVQACKL